MFDKNYILEDTEVKEVPFREYIDWLSTEPDRHVGNTRLEGYWISTVFLGIDHRFDERGPPLLFETMVFAEDPITGKVDFNDLYCDRCSTYEEAEEMHRRAVEKTEHVIVGTEGWE